MDWADIFIRSVVTAACWVALDRLILAGKGWRAKSRRDEIEQLYAAQKAALSADLTASAERWAAMQAALLVAGEKLAAIMAKQASRQESPAQGQSPAAATPAPTDRDGGRAA